jgi:MFS family permease
MSPEQKSGGQIPVAEANHKRWVILGVVYLCMLSLAITLQSVPPVLSLLLIELELSHVQGGLLMSLFALPGIVISIPVGLLADRYSQKAIGLTSLSLMIIGTVVFVSGNSMTVLGLGRVISGLGAMTLGVMLPQLLAQWFARREVGMVMGIFSTAMPLGTILSLNFLSLLAENLSWRVSIWISAGLPLVTLVVFALLFAPAPGRSRPASRTGGIWQDVKSMERPVWTLGVAWLLFNAAVISLFTFTPDLLTDNGFSLARAGFLTSAVMWPALLVSPIIGYMMDRIGYKRLIVILGGLWLAVFIVLVPFSTSWILVLMLLIGVAQTLVPAPIFALLPEVTRPESIGLGFGVVATCLNIGIVLGPSLAGIIRDVTGSYQTSYTVLAGLALLVSATMLTLRRRSSPG